MNSELQLIVPDWPAPANVRAVCSTRTGGVSKPPWQSLNLGDHVGDLPRNVAVNRLRLAQEVGLPGNRLAWLRQVHGSGVVEATRQTPGYPPEADASFTRESGIACAILTADCLAVVLCDCHGTVVGAAHAGWRSLCGGVLENLIAKMGTPAGDLMAWMGPAIGPARFEVGPEVREAFVAFDARAESAFSASGARPGHFMANLYELATQRLTNAGVPSVSGGQWCTVNDRNRFYSYRRDGQTGRMATLIWMTS